MAAHNENTKPLLLFDLNGTLIFRTDEPIKGIPCPIAFRFKHYYPRPNLIAFMRELSKHYRVCVYSSVTRRNIVEFLEQMDKNYAEYIHAIYDRDYNKKDPNGKRDHDTIRDLPKVYAVSGDSDLNTILLDNEPRKVKEYRRNAIIVPEFGKAQVLDGSGSLDDLKDYLIALAQSNPADVRDYLLENPWSEGWQFREMTEALADTLAVSAVPFEITMHFDRCENGVLYYKGSHENDHYTVKTQNTMGTYPDTIQLSRLLELGNGEHFLYKNDEACPYSMDDCFKFLNK